MQATHVEPWGRTSTFPGTRSTRARTVNSSAARDNQPGTYPRGEKHDLTVSRRELIAAGFFKYTMDTSRSHFVVAMVKLTYGFPAKQPLFF